MSPTETWQTWNGDLGRYWAEHADRFDRRTAALTGHLLQALAPDAADRLLDVGCGCGGTSLLAAARVPDGAVRGADLSEPMLAVARARAAAQGLANVTFEAADVQEHPPAAGSYDRVLSRFGVMFFEDPLVAFTGLRRGLRAGGTLTFLCWRGPEGQAYRTVPEAALARVVELPPAPDPARPGPYSLADPDHLHRLLGSAGFTDVSVTAVDEPLWLGDDAEEAARFAVGSPTNRALLEPAGPEVVPRAAEALLAAFRPHQTPDGGLLGAEAWLVSARA